MGGIDSIIHGENKGLMSDIGVDLDLGVQRQVQVAVVSSGSHSIQGNMNTNYGGQGLITNNSVQFTKNSIPHNTNPISTRSSVPITGKLKGLFTNARSICKKENRAALEATVSSEVLDVIAIVETWATPDDDDLLKLRGYNIFRRDRTNRKGGGVLIYVRDDINCSDISIKFNDPLSIHEVEIIWVELTFSENKKVALGVCYRPPDANTDKDKAHDNELFKIIQRTIGTRDLVLLGDFNYPHINWDSLDSSDKMGADFIDEIQDRFLLQLVREPTRSEAILDLILTTDEDLVSNVRVGEHLGNSDHNIIRFDLGLHYARKKSSRKVPIFRKVNFDALRLEVANIFKNGLEASSPDQKWEEFKSKLCSVVNKLVPFKNKSGNRLKDPEWFNKEVQKCFEEKQQAFRKNKSSGKEEDKLIYSNCRRKFKNAQEKQIQEVEHNLAININKDPKSFFAYANSKKSLKQQVGPLKNNRDELITDNTEMATILNDYFKEVFSTDGNITYDIETIAGKSIEHLIFDKDEIARKLLSMKKTKAPGADDIYPTVLVEVAGEISGVLMDIFQSSLDTGIVPEDWKLANVVPIFKQGSRASPGNYRPVSLTSVPVKHVKAKLMKLLVNLLKRRGF